ncbi:MAG: hypothetical protein NTW51_06105 [Cyanobacteria bacterium]|nr:hypothetical protein [Cyanobacteriota bacterium]
MSQLTITLSDKADALIAQLQKEIFNRRRKKVSAAGVIETLVESGAKSQSDKRFATSWSNLVADIEKAARVAHAHGAKPANLSDEEWALVLSHRTRAVAPAASSRRSSGRTRGAAVRRGANANRVAPIATDADTTSSDSASKTASSRSAGGAAKVSRRRSTRPSKATGSGALGSFPETAEPTAAVKRTTKAKSAAKPARTTRIASASPAKESAKPRATKPKVTKPKAAQSKASASQPTSNVSNVAKATPQSSGDSPTSEGATIPATAVAATPTRNRRKAASTTTPAARTRSARVSAATRMAKAVSRLGATTNPAPVAEPPLVPLAISANGSSPSPSELA